MTGIAALAVGRPLLLAVVAMIAVTLQDWRNRHLATIQTIASAVALLAGASAFVDDGLAALCGFTAAGLLGAALSMTKRLDVRRGGAQAESARPERDTQLALKRCSLPAFALPCAIT